MTVLTDIVQVQISRETQAVSRAAFNIPMFLAELTAFAERSRSYTSFSALAEDFKSGSDVYEAGLRYFGQELIPSTVVIGRKQVDSVTGSIGTVSNSSLYSITVDGVLVSITSSASATATNIVTALKAQYTSVGPATVNMVDNLSGTFTLTVAAPGTGWSVASSVNVLIVNGASTETWPDAITAVENSNNEWIVMNASTHVFADILAIAESIEAREKIYGVSSSDANIKTNGVGNLAKTLKDLGYQKTFLMWKGDADENYPECAWSGFQIQPLPGSNTWAYKTLTGTSVDRLTGTETTNLLANNVNTYEEIGGVRATTNGKMVGGEFIDVMVGVLWLTARLRERIWFRLVNSAKIAYTQTGVSIIEAEVRAQLNEGIRNNFLAQFPSFVINVPDVLLVSPNLKATRTLEDLSFEATLAGAIHYVKISGKVFV
jgi:hypothetical protein